MRWQRVFVAIVLWVGLLFGAQKALCLVGHCFGLCMGGTCNPGCVCLREPGSGAMGNCYGEDEAKRMLETGAWRIVP